MIRALRSAKVNPCSIASIVSSGCRLCTLNKKTGIASFKQVQSPEAFACESNLWSWPISARLSGETMSRPIDVSTTFCVSKKYLPSPLIIHRAGDGLLAVLLQRFLQAADDRGFGAWRGAAGVNVENLCDPANGSIRDNC